MISWMPLCRTAWRGQCSTTCAAPILGPGCFGRYVASWIGHKHFFESSDRHCGTEGQLHAQGLDGSGGFPGTSDTRRPALRDGDDGSYYDGCGTVGAGRGKWEDGCCLCRKIPDQGYIWLLLLRTWATIWTSVSMQCSRLKGVNGNVAQGAAARCPAFGLPATGVVFYRAELAGSASSLVLFLQVAGMHHFVFPVVSRWVATSKQLLCHLPRFCFWRWTEQKDLCAAWVVSTIFASIKNAWYSLKAVAKFF